MKHQGTRDRDQMLVIGIEARTSNALEQAGKGKIGLLWQQWFADTVQQRIPNAKSGEMLEIYTDYASDKDGEYTIMLGVEVNSLEDVPDGLSARRLPVARYEVYESDRGPLTQIVQSAWRTIWGDVELEKRRGYKADFEVFGANSQNPDDGSVEIYVSLA